MSDIEAKIQMTLRKLLCRLQCYHVSPSKLMLKGEPARNPQLHLVALGSWQGRHRSRSSPSQVALLCITVVVIMLGRRWIILTKLTTSTEMNKIFTQARGKSGRWGQIRDNSSNLGVQVTITNALNGFFGLTMLCLMQGRPHWRCHGSFGSWRSGLQIVVIVYRAYFRHAIA